MTTREELKQAVCRAIDQRAEEIIRLGDTFMRNPETGFKELKTAQRVAQAFEELGMQPQTGLAITGVKGRLAGRAGGPTLALLGELDSLIVSEHPLADPDTGAAHACGHNAQLAGMIGAAMGLVGANALEHLQGNLVCFAVPAEELIEMDQRLALVEDGKLEFLLGKQELIRLGHFDDVDLAMMTHAIGDIEGASIMVDSSNGAVVKKVRFTGRAAHAGAVPHLGINALNAAHVALAAIHAQRETFREADTIRIHPILTKGGDAVNVVPAEVTMETYVRGKSIEAILDANHKVDRSLQAGALALGAEVEIQTIPGYLPQTNNRTMGDLFGANVASLFGEQQFEVGGHRTSSTDMGDIAHILPAIHPYVGGGKGALHSKDWTIADPHHAYVAPAKLMAMTAVDLLFDQAQEARDVLAKHSPRMSKDEYLALQRGLFATARHRPEAGRSA